jgi:NitT/TauT family transport system substrate-binding protein
MIRKFAIFATIALFGICSFGQLPKLTFTPHWLPQAQFAGYYVADKMGFYRAEGIDVEIVHPSASVNAIESLINGQSDIISLFLITAISSKNSGIDLVNVGQFSQNSALLFITKKVSNINKLSDLNGKEIGVWSSGFDEVGKALIHSNNYNVKWIPILSTINLFLIGGIDAMTVMSFNEYNQIINSGYNEDELNTFFFSDYGYNIPEDGIYCLNKTMTSRKGDLEKFMRATLKGWEYAKEHRSETLDLVLEIMKKEHIPTNKTHQSWMLDKVLELIEPGTKNVRKGELAETDFHNAQSVLIDGEYMNGEIGFNDFYKPVLGK